MNKVVLGAVLAVGLSVSVSATVVSADSSSAVCGFAPGEIHSLFAAGPGPNAGPTSSNAWNGGAGTPNAPGQAVKHNCVNQ